MPKNKNNKTIWSTRINDNTSSLFQKVGNSINIDKRLYNEDIDNYGREDCEMFERLQSIGVKRKDIEFSSNHVPVYHNPHGDNLRSMNRKDSNVDETLSYFIKK